MGDAHEAHLQKGGVGVADFRQNFTYVPDKRSIRVVGWTGHRPMARRLTDSFGESIMDKLEMDSIMRDAVAAPVNQKLSGILDAALKRNALKVVGARQYLVEESDARRYVRERQVDAALLMNGVIWYADECNPNIMRFELYGHSVLWYFDSHARLERGTYEILPHGEAEPYQYLVLEQVLAFILARNW